MIGLFEESVGEQKFYFLFDFKTWVGIEKKVNLPLDTIARKLTASGDMEKLQLFLDIVQYAMQRYYVKKGESKEVSEDEAADAITLLGIYRVADLIAKALTAETPKNSRPLPMEGALKIGE